MPRRRAVAFIRAANAAWLPASHRASIQAMLSAEGSSSAVSAWRSVSLSPAATGTSESPSRACDGYAAASGGWTSISGPDPSAVRGWSCRITYAVITLATLAIGTGRVAPGPYTTPKPLTSAAEAPSAGHETAPNRSWRRRSGGPRRRPEKGRRPEGRPMQLRDDEARQAAECGQTGERGQERPACPAPPVTGSRFVRPPPGPTARWVHACDDAIPASPVCPATVTAVSQRTPEGHL